MPSAGWGWQNRDHDKRLLPSRAAGHLSSRSVLPQSTRRFHVHVLMGLHNFLPLKPCGISKPHTLLVCSIHSPSTCVHSTIRHDHTPSPHDNNDFLDLTHCSFLLQDALFISPSPQTPFSLPSHTISPPSSFCFFEGAERNVFNFQHYSCLYLLYVCLVFREPRLSTVHHSPCIPMEHHLLGNCGPLSERA